MLPARKSFRYVLRSGMLGWLKIMMDRTTWSTEQNEEAKKEMIFTRKMLPSR
jgi:hypothetical protein